MGDVHKNLEFVLAERSGWPIRSYQKKHKELFVIFAKTEDSGFVLCERIVEIECGRLAESGSTLSSLRCIDSRSVKRYYITLEEYIICKLRGDYVD